MAGIISTPLDLITLCLKTAGVIGVGQTADATDVNDCFIILNSMLGQWNRQRFIVYHLVDTAFQSTGAEYYTVGTGGDFDIPRIDEINSAYARLLPISADQPIDFYLSQIFSRESYSGIVMKKLHTFPSNYWYDADYPMGKVYFWPIALDEQFEFHIVTKAVIEAFPTITTEIVLPPEYTDALIWNLSCRIRPLYQLPPEPTQVALAKSSLAVIRSANTQIPELMQPAAVLNRGAGFDASAGNFNGLPFGI